MHIRPIQRISIVSYNLTIDPAVYPNIPSMLFFHAPCIVNSDIVSSIDSNYLTTSDSHPFTLLNPQTVTAGLNFSGFVDPRVATIMDNSSRPGMKELPQVIRCSLLSSTVPVSANPYQGNQGIDGRVTLAEDSSLILKIVCYDNIPSAGKLDDRDELLNIVRVATNV